MKSNILLLFLCLLVSSIPVLSQNTLDKAGLTAATPAAAAYSLRNLSTAYTGPSIKVRRVSDNAEANVAFDISGGLTATSAVTFTPGVSVGTSLGTGQAGTITTAIAKTGTITVVANKTGLITTSNGSLTVTGSGTNFTGDLVAGDLLYNATTNLFIGAVASVASGINLTLNQYATVNATNFSYKTSRSAVTGTGTSFTTELAAGDRLFSATNVYLGTVASISGNTSLLLYSVDATASAATSFKSTSTTVTGSGTNFTSLSAGDLLISNNITLGTIASVGSATSLTLTTKAGVAVAALAYKSVGGTIPFSSFYSGTSVFVNTWYDQSGNARDATQLRSSNQARIVNAGVLYAVNGRTSVEFSGTLTSYLETAGPASYLNGTLYTMNKVTAEATLSPVLSLPISTTGGNGPNNSISHYGYRSSSQFTVAQYSNDQNFSATPSTTLELHTSVKFSTAGSQFYKNGISLGSLSSGAPSNLINVGLLHIGFYTPTNSYFSGSVSELAIFTTALSAANIALLNNNQLTYYSIASTYWTGAVSTDWNDPLNWSTSIVPTLTDPAIVLIPAGKPRYPVITATSLANSISLEAATSVTVTGILQLAGGIVNLGTFTASGGTIKYVGPAQQGITANVFAGNTIQNLVLNNTGGIAMNGNLTVSGNLTFTTGAISINAAVLTLGGTVTNTIAGGFLNCSTGTIAVNGTVSPTLSFDQTTPGTTNALKSLTINSAGQTVSLANNLVMAATGITTFTAGKLGIGATTLDIKGLVVNTVTEGLKGGATSNLLVDGSVSPTLSFDQTIPGTTNALSNLTVNSAGQTITLGRSISVLTALNLPAGIFADGGNQVTSTATLNLTGGTFKLGSVATATTWPAFTTNTITGAGTAEYAAGVAQTVSATPVYQNLTISATGGGTANNNMTVNGLLSLSAANPSATQGALSTGAFTLLMGPSATTAGQGDVTGFVKRTTILANVNYTMGNEFTNITFPAVGTLPSQMSMNITIGSVASWQSGAVKRIYDFIQTGGAGTKAVITAHYLDAELSGNVESKLVDFSYRFAGGILTEHGKSNSNSIQNWITLSNVNIAFFGSAFGATQLTLDESTLTDLTWNGSTSTSWITATNWTPNGGPSTNTNLIVPDAATTPNDPSMPATASNGSLTIQAGGIVNADPGAAVSFNNTGLVWSNAGQFNAGTSTITFSNAFSSVNGTTNFNNVVIATGASLQMTTGTITRIGGTITNNGTWISDLLPNIIEYNGAAQTVLIPNGPTASYYSLIISGTGTTTLPAGALSILGDLTINGTISTAGSIQMNGAIVQTITGSSALALNLLTINNSSTGVLLGQHMTVGSTLAFTAGKLAIGAHNLTLNGSIVNSSPGGISGGPNSNLTLSGAFSPTLSFDQSTPGITNSLNNLTINSGGQVPLLGSTLVLTGTLAFSAGKLDLNGNSLTLAGPIANTVPGGLRGNISSSLFITGGTASPILSFDQTTPGASNLLGNFSMNSPGQTSTLGNPLVLSSNLDLTDGYVVTTSANSLTLAASAGFTGGSMLSFVEGPLVRNTATTGDVVFPVGKSNTYRYATVTPQTTSPGVYQTEYFLATPPTGTLGGLLESRVTNEYWDIGRLSGPTATVTLDYQGNDTWTPGNPSALDYIHVIHFNAGTWDPENGSLIRGNTGSGHSPLTSQVMTSFSPFTFGYTSAFALPLTLIRFQVARAGESNQVFWTTAGEYSLRNFEIQRSFDGVAFHPIGSVPATNKNLDKAYNWFDNQPKAGVNYYKLKMIDMDALFRYSQVVRIDNSAGKSMSFYPNPAHKMITLQLGGQPDGMYVVSQYNPEGRKMKESQLFFTGNTGALVIPLSQGASPGVYYLKITDPKNQTTVLRVMTE